MADRVARIGVLYGFNSQFLANTVCAFAKAGISHSNLFEKVANRIIGQDNLDRFDTQALSNTLWAYAKAGFNHPELFDKWPITLLNLTKWIGSTLKTTARFPHPELFKKAAILLWSYAKMGDINKQLFLSFVSTAAELIDSCNNQHLADISGRMQ